MLNSLMIGLEEAAEEAVETTGNMGMFDNFFSLLLFAAGAFMIYSAVVGKGPAFRADYPASMQKEATALLRKFYWILGPVAAITGILDFIYKDSIWPYIVSIAIIMPTIVVYIIIFRRKFKDDLKRMR